MAYWQLYFLNIYFLNYIRYFFPIFWFVLGEEYRFNRQTLSSADTLGLRYDYESIMHYGTRIFAINGKKIIISRYFNKYYVLTKREVCTSQISDQNS